MLLMASSDPSCGSLSREESTWRSLLGGLKTCEYGQDDFQELVSDVKELGKPEFLRTLPITIGSS